MIESKEELRRILRAAVRKTPIADRMTRLYADMLTAPSGIDALFTSPELLREADCAASADTVFQRLFLDRSPVSDAAQRVIWSLKKLNLPLGERNLARLRAEWDALPPSMRAIAALDAANVASVAIRCPVFENAPIADSPFALDDRLRPCLDATALLDWRNAVRAENTSLAEKAEALHAESILIEAHPTDDYGSAMFENHILPACQARKLPLYIASEMEENDPLPRRFAERGLTRAPWHSGVHAIEALPGHWELARREIAETLFERYARLLKSGWRLSAAEVEHDVRRLFA